MKNYFLSLLLIFVSLCSYGQGGQVIHGKIVNEDNEPIQGAIITTLSGETICITDIDGSFKYYPTSYCSHIVIEHNNYIRTEIKVDGSFQYIKMRLTREQRNINKERVVAKLYQVEKGWKNSVALSIGAAGSDIEHSIGFDYIGGSRLSNILFLGFGTGLHINTDGFGLNYPEQLIRNLDGYTECSLLPISVPIYLTSNIYIKPNRRIQPYIFISGGIKLSGKRNFMAGYYEFKNKNDYQDYKIIDDFSYHTSQIFITPGIGLDCCFSSGSAIFLQAGFQMCTFPFIRSKKSYDSITLYYKQKLTLGYSVNIGFRF